MTNIAQDTANFLLNDLKGILRKTGHTLKTCPLSAVEIGLLLGAMDAGELTRAEVKQRITEACRRKRQ